MIEDNELGALAPSRLGLNEFVDDQWAYRNYTGSEDFFNLFGSIRVGFFAIAPN